MMASVRQGHPTATVAQASNRESFSVLQFLQQECGDNLGVWDAQMPGLESTKTSIGAAKRICDKDYIKDIFHREPDARNAYGIATKDRDTPVVRRKSFKDLLGQEDHDYSSQSTANLSVYSPGNSNQLLTKQPQEICKTFPTFKQESRIVDDNWFSHDDIYDSAPTAAITAAAATAAAAAADSTAITTTAAHINPYITHNTCRPQVFHTSDYSRLNADLQLQLMQNDFKADYVCKNKIETQFSGRTLQHTKYDEFSGTDKVKNQPVSGSSELNVMKTREMLIQTIEEKRETTYTKDKHRYYFAKLHKFNFDDKNGSSIVPVDNQYFEYKDVFRDQNEINKTQNKHIIESELSNNYVCSNKNNKESLNNNESNIFRHKSSMKKTAPDKYDRDDQISFILKPESLLSFEDLSEIIKEEVIEDVSEDNKCSTRLIDSKTNKKKNSKKKEKHNLNPDVITLCDSTTENTNHEDFESINYVCNICGYKCKHKDIFANHMLSHNSPPSKAYRKERLIHECPICGYKCRHKSIFLNHMASHKVTDTYLKFGCNFCNFRCNFRRSLKQHAINHDTKKMFSCTECDYRNTSANQYHEHITNTGHKVFRCSICKEKFNCHKDFSAHKQIHPSRKCPECGKLFNSKFRLLRHLQYESEDNKFECKYCNETFRTNCILRIHISNHKKRPFNCSLCTKNFTRLDNLRIHMSSHNGQKPFSCSVCDKKYTKKAYLRKHLIEHNH